MLLLFEFSYSWLLVRIIETLIGAGIVGIEAVHLSIDVIDILIERGVRIASCACRNGACSCSARSIFRNLAGRLRTAHIHAAHIAHAIYIGRGCHIHRGW